MRITSLAHRDAVGWGHPLHHRLAAAWLIAAAAPAFAAAAPASDAETIARGEYLARIMDCGGCHMQRGPDGAPIVEAGLSGGTIGFEMPGLGVFWPPNITPDATGIGDWSVDEVKAAIRDGVRPDGRQLVPVMPYPNYAALSEEDLDALARYLLAAAPVANPMPGPIGPGETAALPFYRVTLPE